MTCATVLVAAATTVFAEDAYVASSGGQAINTGYRINSNTKLEVDFKIGGAHGELTVVWAKGGATDAYTVTPVYDVFGTKTDGAAIL